MIVLVDSREKKNSHILDYFRKQKIAYQVEKLEYGDYSFMIPAAAAGDNHISPASNHKHPAGNSRHPSPKLWGTPAAE